jgi:hypothetical protein
MKLNPGLTWQKRHSIGSRLELEKGEEDKVDEEVLDRVKEKRNIINTVGRLTGLVTSCLGTAF